MKRKISFFFEKIKRKISVATRWSIDIGVQGRQLQRAVK